MTSATARLLNQERARQATAIRHLPTAAARLADAVCHAVDALAELDPDASPEEVRAAMQLWFDSHERITTAEDAVLEAFRDAELPIDRPWSGAR